MTVNGTGPSTSWMSGRTFSSDLDESVVPHAPRSLSAKASRGASLTLSWRPPPQDSGVLVRGYHIGWGLGIPVSLPRKDIVKIKSNLI